MNGTFTQIRTEASAEHRLLLLQLTPLPQSILTPYFRLSTYLIPKHRLTKQLPTVLDKTWADGWKHLTIYLSSQTFDFPHVSILARNFLELYCAI